MKFIGWRQWSAWEMIVRILQKHLRAQNNTYFQCYAFSDFYLKSTRNGRASENSPRWEYIRHMQGTIGGASMIESMRVIEVREDILEKLGLESAVTW